MRYLFLLLAAAVSVSAQIKTPVKPAPKPTPTPVAEDIVAKNGGKIVDRTYSNETLKFKLTLPAGWFFAGRDFETVLKAEGIDLSTSKTSAKLLLTAFTAETESKKSAVLRVASEDLTQQPQIKDEVDYLDSVRASFKRTRLPAGFVYGETGAEELGRRQYAYLDISTSNGNKRIYVKFRGRNAILMTVSYIDAVDLERFRDILEKRGFDLL
ncbi:MAG TPA: hypothetical protein PKA82_17255 [Pyrinomonadaceae bacterium]|nr:hypothetical protein [Pyrinomonadaceae bacterium]